MPRYGMYRHARMDWDKLDPSDRHSRAHFPAKIKNYGPAISILIRITPSI